MKSEDYKETGEGSSGETGGEVITTTADTGPNTSLVSGFSNKQVNSLIIIISAMMDTKLEAYFGRLDQTRQQSNPIPTIQHSNQQINPITSIEPPQQRQSTPPQPTNTPPAQVIATTTKQEIRAEEVRYFNPKYQQE